MKKEKTIKTYQRRTKSGKVVTVKQHTAKYDAADKAKEMASKKGAGEELAAKKGMPDHNLPMNEYLEELKKLRKGETPEETPMEKETKKSSKTSNDKVMERAKAMYSHSGSNDRIVVYLQKKGYSLSEAQKKLKSIERAAKKERQALADKGLYPTTGEKSKSVKSTKSTKNATTTQANGVSASDFKSWYHFNDWDKPKKSWPAEVRAADAAIRKQLGSKKAYDDYCAQIDNSYSKRGHSTAFTTFGNLAEGAATSNVKPTSTGAGKRKPKWQRVIDKLAAKITQAKADAIMGKSPANKETSASLRKRADEMDATNKKAAIEKKVGKGFRTIKNARLNSPGANTRTATLKGDLYIGKDGSAYYADPTNKGKLKKASERVLALNKVSTSATSGAKSPKSGKFISQAETTKLINSAISKAKRTHQRDLSGLFEDSILSKVPKDKLKSLSPDRVWNALDAANMRYQKRRNKYDPSYRAETYKLDNISKYLSKFSDDKGAAKKNGQAGPAQLRKASPSTKALTSSQKHAINTLLSQPGWTMSKAEKYVRSLSPKEVMKIRRNE